MIHVENLTKNFQELCAVDQISFDIPRGEILGLLGPNGAGKTTTLRMLTGFLKPTAGNITVKDFDIRANSREIRKMLGYLPESAPLYHDMLVYDYLNYVADIHELNGAAKKDRIRELGKMCGLNEVMHKPISELSKGYKQRVGLAHAMMNDPEILILDEPTSGLDPNQIIEIRDIIKQIGKEKTVILSTHILSEAEATCDRIVIINKGKIVADDRTEELKQSAKEKKIINICLENTDLAPVEQAFQNIEGIIGITGRTDENGQLHLKVESSGAKDIRSDIYQTIKGTEWILLDFHQETRTLEHIFREITREN
jgi:ABC-2 type transport system ATP-binding protein